MISHNRHRDCLPLAQAIIAAHAKAIADVLARFDEASSEHFAHP